MVHEEIAQQRCDFYIYRICSTVSDGAERPQLHSQGLKRFHGPEHGLLVSRALLRLVLTTPSPVPPPHGECCGQMTTCVVAHAGCYNRIVQTG